MPNNPFGFINPDEGMEPIDANNPFGLGDDVLEEPSIPDTPAEEEVRLSKTEFEALKNGQMRHSDYTKKTQLTAEERRQLTEDRKQLEEERRIWNEQHGENRSAPVTQEEPPAYLTQEQAMELYEARKQVDQENRAFLEEFPEVIIQENDPMQAAKEELLDNIAELMETHNIGAKQAYYMLKGPEILKQKRDIEAKLGEASTQRRSDWDGTINSASTKKQKVARNMDEADEIAGRQFDARFGIGR